MRKSPKFSPEMRERAVRMVQEHRSEHPSQWAAIESIAAKVGCVPQTFHIPGSSNMRLTLATATVCLPPRLDASRSSSARTTNCARPMRF